MRLLLVDDDPVIRRVTEVALRRVGGVTVLTAANCEAGLTVLREQTIDVVLLDVMMPQVDGAATLARIRELPECSSLPVIFLTARHGAGEEARLLALGAAGVVRKPFDPRKLSETVRAIVAVWVPP